MSDFSEIMATWQQEKLVRQQEKLKSASLVARELKAVNIESITFCYEGCGDSGAIESTYWQPDDINVPSELKSKIETLEELVYELLPSGWEINEGSAGDVSFDLTSGEININHKWLEYVESDCSSDFILDLGQPQNL